MLDFLSFFYLCQNHTFCKNNNLKKGDLQKAPLATNNNPAPGFASSFIQNFRKSE